MGNQMRIAMSVIGALLILLVAALYVRLNSNPVQTDIRQEIPVHSVEVSNPAQPQAAEPTMVDDRGPQLPQEAFNPNGEAPPAIGPSPDSVHSGDVVEPSEGLLTPPQFEARRPVSPPLDDRRFQLEPSQLNPTFQPQLR